MSVSMIMGTEYANFLQKNKEKEADKAFKKGYCAFHDCDALARNPHFPWTDGYQHWLAGWRKGFQEFNKRFEGKNGT